MKHIEINLTTNPRGTRQIMANVSDSKTGKRELVELRNWEELLNIRRQATYKDSTVHWYGDSLAWCHANWETEPDWESEAAIENTLDHGNGFKQTP